AHSGAQGLCTRTTASPATKERTPETSTRAGSCETASTSADIEPRLMSNAAASAIRDGPIRPAIVFEFAMDCIPARCRCGTSTDKNTHREEPVRRSAATGPTPAISRREQAEKERAPPLHDNPKARRRGGRQTSSLLRCKISIRPMTAAGLGRFKTFRQRRFKLREKVNKPFSDFRLCSDRGHERLNAHNIHHAGKIVREHVQRLLGSDLGQTFHQEVGRPHPHLQCTEGMMFGRLATLAHSLRVLVEALLYGLQYMLMLPAGDPSLLASGAALFNSATLTGVGPIAAQN